MSEQVAITAGAITAKAGISRIAAKLVENSMLAAVNTSVVQIVAEINSHTPPFKGYRFPLPHDLVPPRDAYWTMKIDSARTSLAQATSPYQRERRQAKLSELIGARTLDRIQFAEEYDRRMTELLEKAVTQNKAFKQNL